MITKAIEINPQDADSYYNRTMLHDLVIITSTVDYTIALEINPEYAIAMIIGVSQRSHKDEQKYC